VINHLALCKSSLDLLKYCPIHSPKVVHERPNTPMHRFVPRFEIERALQ